MVISVLNRTSPSHQRFTYPFQNTFHVLHHIVVPEPKDAIVSGFQGCGARRVSFRLLTVMSSVQFNHQIFRAAAKIDDVATYYELARELETTKLSLSQVMPQLVLRRGEVTP